MLFCDVVLRVREGWVQSLTRRSCFLGAVGLGKQNGGQCKRSSKSLRGGYFFVTTNSKGQCFFMHLHNNSFSDHGHTMGKKLCSFDRLFLECRAQLVRKCRWNFDQACRSANGKEERRQRNVNKEMLRLWKCVLLLDTCFLRLIVRNNLKSNCFN